MPTLAVPASVELSAQGSVALDAFGVLIAKGSFKLELGTVKESAALSAEPEASRAVRRKQSPPEQTNAEEFYYLKQMTNQTRMVIVLKDGEQIRGTIEWYDKHCLKINRIKEPNLLVPKHNIKYLYKAEEEPRIRRTRSTKKEEPASPEMDLPLYD